MSRCYFVYFERMDRDSGCCDAESPQEAIRIMRAEFNSSWRPVRVSAIGDPGPEDEWEVVGSCENCGIVLLDGEDYITDPDEGHQFCLPCIQALKNDQVLAEERL